MTRPSEPTAHRLAGEQRSAYRRGFVLGLTLAETVLLLTFVVLLLLVVGVTQRDEALAQLAELLGVEAKPDAVAQAKVDLLRAQQLRALLEEHEVPWDDAFTELVRGVLAVRQEHPQLVEIAKALRIEREKMSTLLERLESETGHADPHIALDTLLDDRSAAQIQVAQLDAENTGIREQLKRIGGVLPSCWFEQGRPVYVLDVVLTSEGIRARDRTPSAFVAAREALLSPTAFTDATVLTPEEFLGLTARLFEYSVKHECRFYVAVYDATRADEKERYKTLLTAVEGHFYKLQSRDAAPF